MLAPVSITPTKRWLATSGARLLTQNQGRVLRKFKDIKKLEVHKPSPETHGPDVFEN